MAKYVDTFGKDYDIYVVTLATGETLKVSVPHVENGNNEIEDFCKSSYAVSVLVDTGLNSKLVLRKSDVKNVKFCKTMQKAIGYRITDENGNVTEEKLFDDTL